MQLLRIQMMKRIAQTLGTPRIAMAPKELQLSARRALSVASAMQITRL